MSIEDDKALMRQWAETFNPGRLGAARELITGDFVAHVGSSADSVNWERYRQLGELLLKAFPDGHVSVEEIVVEGDRGVIRWTYRGTHTGAFFGIAPTGKHATTSAIEINRMTGGKIAETWLVMDTAGLLQQLRMP